MTKERCALCKKGRLEVATINKMIEIGPDIYAAKELRGLTCRGCGETFFSGAVMDALEMAIAEAIARAGMPSGAGFRHMRKALGLRATEVAKALNVTPETISQWETVKREIPRTAFLVMSRLVEDVIASDNIATVTVTAALRSLDRQQKTSPIEVGALKIDTAT